MKLDWEEWTFIVLGIVRQCHWVLIDISITIDMVMLPGITIITTSTGIISTGIAQAAAVVTTDPDIALQGTVTGRQGMLVLFLWTTPRRTTFVITVVLEAAVITCIDLSQNHPGNLIGLQINHIVNIKNTERRKVKEPKLTENYPDLVVTG